ncbi:MAG: beta-propeller fold lactonase family protein [Deltaproteobacteria bacterium]|nr:beta-propeller fold lactonase family protein [Deltaproteobacteria bacterium]MBI3388898.1 beta-propeller fold lactonase family protein [Deltaproteobacteria bacterium]
MIASALSVLLIGCGGSSEGAAHPTASPTLVPTATKELTATPTPPPTQSPTASGTPTASVTSTATVTPTPTSSQTPTLTSCGVAAPPLVDPVISPTDLLQQTITGFAHLTGARSIIISSEGRCQVDREFNLRFSATCTLLPNQINHVEVCLYNSCGAVQKACTRRDVNGAPLEIAQVASLPTLTPTPSPTTPAVTPTSTPTPSPTCGQTVFQFCPDGVTTCPRNGDLCCVCEATRTPTPTPTITSTSTPDCGAIAPRLDPLPVSTDELKIHVTGTYTAFAPDTSISVCSEAACFYQAYVSDQPSSYHQLAFDLTLKPNGVNHITACGRSGFCRNRECKPPIEILQTCVETVHPDCLGATSCGPCCLCGATNTRTPTPTATAPTPTITPTAPTPTITRTPLVGRFAYITNYGGDSVTVIDTATNTIVTDVTVGRAPFRVATTPDGRFALVTRPLDDLVTIIATLNNSVVANVRVFRPSGIGISPDGATAYVSESIFGTVAAINVQAGIVQAAVCVGGLPDDVAVAPDGDILYVTDRETPTLHIVDLDERLTLQRSLPVSARTGAVAVAPDGATAYVGSTSAQLGSLWSFDTAALMFVDHVDFGTAQPAAVRVTADGTAVFVTDVPSGSVSVVEPDTLHLKESIAAGDALRGIAFTPDTALAYVADQAASTVIVLDTVHGTVASTIEGLSNPADVAIADLRSPTPCDGGAVCTPRPTFTHRPTRTRTPTLTPTLTLTPTDTPTPTQTLTPCFANQGTPCTPLPTATPTRSVTATAALNATSTITATRTPTLCPPDQFRGCACSGPPACACLVCPPCPPGYFLSATPGKCACGFGPSPTPTQTHPGSVTRAPVATFTPTITPMTPTVSPTCSQTVFQFCPDGVTTCSRIGNACCICEATNTPSATPTPTSTCAPTGTPYHSDDCRPCPTIREGCYASGCGQCIQNPTATPTPTVPTPTATPTATHTPALCVTGLNPEMASVPGTGGSACTNVIAPADCCWEARVRYGYVLEQGCGNGVVCYSLGFNDGQSFRLYIDVGSRTFVVSQSMPSSPTTSSTATVTVTPTATRTLKPTQTPTTTPTITHTRKPTATSTPSFTRRPTQTPTPSSTPRPTRSPTASVTPTPSKTPRPSITPTPTPTQTPLIGRFAYVTNYGGDSVSVIDLATNAIVRNTVVGRAPFHIAITPDGRFAYVTRPLDDLVSVIDTASNSVIRDIRVDRWPAGIAISPDARTVYVASEVAGVVDVIDVGSNAIRGIVAVGGEPSSLAVAPGGASVYVTNSRSTCLSVVDVETLGRADHSIGLPSGVVAASPDGARLYVSTHHPFADALSFVDPTSFAIGSKIDFGVALPQGVAVSANSARVYVTDAPVGFVSIIDPSAGSVIGSVGVGIYPRGIALTSDGTLAYVANEASRSVSVIDTETITVARTISFPNYPVDVAIADLRARTCVGDAPCTATPTFTTRPTHSATPTPTVTLGVPCFGGITCTPMGTSTRTPTATVTHTRTPCPAGSFASCTYPSSSPDCGADTRCECIACPQCPPNQVRPFGLGDCLCIREPTPTVQPPATPRATPTPTKISLASMGVA